jgi:hypothetical protein
VTKEGTKVPVTTRALIQRINRRLAREDEQLRASRGWRLESNVGRYYVLDLTRNVVTRIHVDIEALGRKLTVLRAWERLMQESE